MADGWRQGELPCWDQGFHAPAITKVKSEQHGRSQLGFAKIPTEKGRDTLITVVVPPVPPPLPPPDSVIQCVSSFFPSQFPPVL